MLVTNLFAYRATDPRELTRISDATGPLNDQEMVSAARDSDMVVAAWGVHGTLRERARDVRSILKPYRLHHLGLTKDGHPRHPLYLRANLRPTMWDETTCYLHCA